MGLVVTILALAGIAVALMQTLVIPIVSRLPSLLDAAPSDTTWAVTATLLAAAVVTPIAGRLGDMLGKRPVLLASVVAMVAGSVICASTDSLTVFIVGRAIQGLASGVIPLGISLMRDILPDEKLGSAVAMMSASLGVGGALGLPLASLIVEHANWHVLFWVSAGLGVVVFLLIAALIPGSSSKVGGRLDVLGAVGLSVTLVALLLGVSKGADWGWDSGRVVGLLAGAVIVALLWGMWQLRTTQPLVDLRTTARRQVLLTNLASVIFGFSLFAMSLVIPQLVQLPAATGYGLGQSILVSGLTMVPSGLLMIVAAPVSARVSRRYGPKVTLMIGALVVALGYGFASVFMGEVWQLATASGIIGVGVGFAYGSMPALIMSAVPRTETAAANSFNTLLRSIGTSVSSAVAGAVLAGSTVALGGVAVPSENAFRTILVLASGAALVALLIAAFLPRQALTATDAHAHAAIAATDDRTDPVPMRADQHVTTDGASDHAAARRALGGPEDPWDDQPVAWDLGTSTSAVDEESPAVFGTVWRSPRVPLAGATVTLAERAGGQVGRVVTDSQGRYRLPVRSGGTFLMIVAAPRMAPDANLVDVGDRAMHHDVTLVGSSTLTGRVLGQDHHGADRLVGIAEVLVSLVDQSGDVVASSTTGADGGYSFERLSAGSYVLTAQAHERRPLARQVDIDDSSALAVDLQLTGPGRLTGGVAAPHGTGLAGTLLTLTRADGHIVTTARSGADGDYTFDRLEPGHYTLAATSYAPVARTVVVEEDSTTTLQVTFTETPPAHQDDRSAVSTAPAGGFAEAQL